MTTPRLVDEEVREAVIWKDSSHSLMLSDRAITSTVDSNEFALKVTMLLDNWKSLSAIRIQDLIVLKSYVHTQNYCTCVHTNCIKFCITIYNTNIL